MHAKSSMMSKERDSIGCQYRIGDSSGSSYDANGNVCNGGLSSEQKGYIIAGSVVCAVVVLVLAAVLIRRHLRMKAKARTASLVPERPMSSLGSPLIKARRMSQMSQRPASMVSLGRSHLSPLSVSTEFQPLDASSSGSHSPNPSSNSSHSSTFSPYSPNPENFAFPILSADGHLLPPPPASTRRSFIDVSEATSSQRPLPLAPAPVSGPYFAAPTPVTPKRWSYLPARDSSPSPERDIGTQSYGLYAGSNRNEGSIELLREDLDLETVPQSASPSISRASYQYRPQSAVYHSTFSAEGEDLGDHDYGSEEGHRRY